MEILNFKKNKYFVLILLLFSFSSDASLAKEFGLGVVVGSVTGISANYFLSQNRSIDMALSYDLGRNDRLHIYGDYLWRQDPWINIGTEKFGTYWGFGAKLKTADEHDEQHFHYHDHDDEEEVNFGPRVVGGMNYFFRPVPIEVYLEGSLTLNIIPSTNIDLLVGLGGRYYF